jgi:hypothetical protein
MAAGPITRIDDVVVPEIFTPYTQQITEEKARIIQSGLAVRSAALDALLAGGGLTFNVPSFRDLDNDADRIPTDDSVPFSHPDASLPAGVARPPNPLRTGTSKEIAVRLNRNNSWSTSDLAAVLAGADPMASIADRVGYYCTRRLQAAFIATWRGVIADNTANDSSDYQYDVSGTSFVDGVTNFTTEAFIDACLTMGDSMEDITTMVVHSVVYARMQKNNLIDFIPDSVGAVNIPTFLGRQVIVDDGVPRTGSVYDTWLFGSGATLIGVGSPPNATEIERKPGAGNGGGQDVLYNRVMWTIHPVGHAWVGASTPDGGPANTGTSNSDLDEAASWNRVFPERKQIKFARLVTRES